MTQFASVSWAFYSSYLVLWVLVLTMAALLVLVFRQFGLMALSTFEGVQRDGIPVGEQALALSGITSAGADVRWVPGDGNRTLISFVSPDCAPCEAVMPHIAKLAAGNGDMPSFDVIAVTRGGAAAAHHIVEKFAPAYPVVAEDKTSIFNEYRVRVTPFAFLVDQAGVVRAKGLISGLPLLARLLEEGGERRTALALTSGSGAPAPTPDANFVTSGG